MCFDQKFDQKKGGSVGQLCQDSPPPLITAAVPVSFFSQMRKGRIDQSVVLVKAHTKQWYTWLNLVIQLKLTEVN